LKISSSRFVRAAYKPEDEPTTPGPDVVFLGRSNVGKSSLINALTGVSSLARTSNTPGRTRLLNWFEVTPPTGPRCCFVDLPGYGYAKVSRSMREAWRPLIEAYLADRPVLRALVLLCDARRGAESEERDLLGWLAAADVGAICVVTKIDKLAKSKRKPAGAALARALGLSRPPLLCSAQTGDGLPALWRQIGRALGE
jgi:GTP-binding protein